MYLSLGSGKFVDETRFSVLSAARFAEPGSDWSMVIYTDSPELYEGLPVTIRPVDQALEREWIGERGYLFRFKILALAHSLTVDGVERSAFVDGDTYFKRSPAELFARIAPGRSVMHIKEGRPAPPEIAGLDRVLAKHTPVDLDGRPWSFGAEEVLWNSGVVGLHRADSGLSREAVSLNDQLVDHGFAGDLEDRTKRFWYGGISEMVAHSVTLSRRTTLSEVRDIVVHYWQSDLNKPFREPLQDIMSEPGLTWQQKFDRLWPRRPLPSATRRVKVLAKRMLWKVGVEVGRPGG